MPRPRRSHTIQEKPVTFKQNTDLYYTEDQVSVQLRQCRICLEGAVTGAQCQNKLITPCKCTGSVQFIHFECMRLWLQKNLKGKGNSPIKCELCKQPIIYSIISTRQCSKCSIVQQKIRLNYKIFIFLLFLLLLNCGVTIYLIVIFVHILSISDGDPKFIEIGVISFSIVLLLVISSILCGIMIRQFVYCESKKIGQIANYSERSRKLSNYSCNDTKMNISKAQIVPLAIIQISQHE